jgi:hypothetical protein
MICTSKWRIPATRLAASRTVAKASGRISSSVAPCANLLLQDTGLRPQLVVGQRNHPGLERVHRIEQRRQFADFPLGARAEKCG